MNTQLIQDFEKKFKSSVKCNFDVGDTINIHTKIIEGEKERIQVFTGTVVSMKGKGISKTVTLYRNAYGVSMERVFLLNSPRITKIEMEKKGKVKKAKLYHLRGETGKRAKIQEQFIGKEGKESLEKAAFSNEDAQVKSVEEKVGQEIVDEKMAERPKEAEEKTKEKKKTAVKKVKKVKKEE